MTPGDPSAAVYNKMAEDPAPPSHVAIIMDGNGRWATGRNLPRAAGHQRGSQAVKTAIKAAIEAGVDYLTLYGFSSENWNRPQDEVEDLMGLLRLYLKNEIKNLHKQGVRVLVIGDRERLESDFLDQNDNPVALLSSTEQCIPLTPQPWWRLMGSSPTTEPRFEPRPRCVGLVPRGRLPGALEACGSRVS